MTRKIYSMKLDFVTGYQYCLHCNKNTMLDECKKCVTCGKEEFKLLGGPRDEEFKKAYEEMNKNSVSLLLSDDFLKKDLP